MKPNEKDDWKARIVYDSKAERGFTPGWGFSVLLSKRDFNLLFDCGWDGHTLRDNLGRLGLTFADLDMVFISHGHWDHISGLTEILHDMFLPDQIEVALPSSLSANLKREISKRVKIREISARMELLPSIWSTGPLGAGVAEQALVIDCGGKGIVVTGCCHPGMREVLKEAEEIVEPNTIIGGIHDSDPAEIPDSIGQIILCHCTHNVEEIKKRFGARVSIGSAGAVYDLVHD
ncbi:MAG: MBL fold metallo-hydrolase [Thermoplasmata archaeon]|nr:MBL fold metallo-hydrolase [Thermoplasmata archaeon]